MQLAWHAIPLIEFSYNVVPCRSNPIAVLDALGERGVDRPGMKLTAARLQRAVRGATPSKPA